MAEPAQQSPPSLKTKKRRKRKKKEKAEEHPFCTAVPGEDGKDTEPPEACAVDSRSSEKTPYACAKKNGQKYKSKPPPSLSSSSHLRQDTPILPGERGSSSTLEEELEWCVRQLELGTLRSDASKAQKQENERHVRTLCSPKAPLPRKRQLMRSLFGDYRSKMKLETCPSADLVTKIVAIEKEALASTATYYRKAKSRQSKRTSHSSALEAQDGCAARDTGFHFNFDVA